MHIHRDMLNTGQRSSSSANAFLQEYIREGGVGGGGGGMYSRL